ncbi:MAG: hypothetical protein HY077_14025 [Elusimicrobia bacterium]|nr:hypothetical protein [Elusimicrobiota bacterium]
MSSKNTENLLEELAALGRQIQKSIVAAAQSDELKELGSEMAASLKKVGGKTAEAIEAAKKSRESKDLGDRLKKVAAAGKEAGKDVGGKAYENVAHGLSELGAELGKLADKLKERYRK